MLPITRSLHHHVTRTRSTCEWQTERLLVPGSRNDLVLGCSVSKIYIDMVGLSFRRKETEVFPRAHSNRSKRC
jgi:hypothetical protein